MNLEVTLKRFGPKYIFIPEGLYTEEWGGRGDSHTISGVPYMVVTFQVSDIALLNGALCNNLCPENISVFNESEAVGVLYD